MRIYWVWLLCNVIIWSLAVVYFELSIVEMTVSLFGTALYFAIFFISPLVERKPLMLILLLILNAMIAIIVFFPDESNGLNPYLLLILALLMGEGFYRLSLRYSLIVGGIIAAG